MRKIEIYTDGGCNQLTDRKGTWAFVVVENDKVIDEAWGNIDKTTNSVVELTAMKNAYLYALTFDKNVKIDIFTDSMYIYNGSGKWGDKWESNGYNNGKIKYQHLWKSFLPYRKPNIKVKWIKGHNGNKWNEYADKLTLKGRVTDNSYKKYTLAGKIYDLINANISTLSDDDYIDIRRLIYYEDIRRGIEASPVPIKNLTKF